MLHISVQAAAAEKNQIDTKVGEEYIEEDFRFQLTWDEVEELSRSKILTLNKEGRGGNVKYLPWCFTESGVYMLMTVLKGNLATRQSKALIRIVRKFRTTASDGKNYNVLHSSGI